MVLFSERRWETQNRRQIKLYRLTGSIWCEQGWNILYCRDKLNMELNEILLPWQIRLAKPCLGIWYMGSWAGRVTLMMWVDHITFKGHWTGLDFWLTHLNNSILPLWCFNHLPHHVPCQKALAVMVHISYDQVCVFSRLCHAGHHGIYLINFPLPSLDKMC